MAKKISLSSNTPSLDEVANFYSDARKSIYHYYANPSPGNLDPKFIGYSRDQLLQERDGHLRTLEETCAFSILAALEARFRIDFHLRCAWRLKDDLSRHFREAQKRPGSRISLEEDILDAWKSHDPSSKSLVSELKTALNYRHWFAHGRYYLPKLGKKYDFITVYDLAQLIHQRMKLLE